MDIGRSRKWAGAGAVQSNKQSRRKSWPGVGQEHGSSMAGAFYLFWPISAPMLEQGRSRAGEGQEQSEN